MTRVFNLADGLLASAQAQFQAQQYRQAQSTLQRLLALPALAPRLAAEANHLLAQTQLFTASHRQARVLLQSTLAQNPSNAQTHFLLARHHDLDRRFGSPTAALSHYQQAAQLAPEQGRLQSAYGRKLTEVGQHADGLAVLEQTYLENPDDPEVVEDFLEGLIQSSQYDDAELLAQQVQRRYPDNHRFRRLRQTVRQRVCQERLKQHRQHGSTTSNPAPTVAVLASTETVAPATKSDTSTDRTTVPFRTFARTTATHVAATPLPTNTTAVPFHAGPPEVAPHEELRDLLQKMGPVATKGIARNLGVKLYADFAAQCEEVVRCLRATNFLDRQLAHLPPETLRLLRTVVRAGGFVPASILFQSDGPDSPAPDYVQPLLQLGLLIFGHESTGRTRPRLVAVVAADLLDTLAVLLSIKLT